MFRYLAVKVGCDVKPDILFGMKRRDKPRGPVVWSVVGVSMRSDISSLPRDSGVVLDCCLDI